MLADSRSPMASSATSSLSTSERNPCSSNFTGIAGSTTNTPSARKKVGYRQAIHSEKARSPQGDRAFLLAAAILSFLFIAATVTGDAIAKGHGTYIPMVFGCQ